jgi:hypothetical protein
MISTELANLSDYCLGWAAEGRSMPPREAAILARVLLDLSRQAKQLKALQCDTSELHDAA